MTWGVWVSPFCRAKSDFWGPRPLRNEEPATNLARGFLYKIRVPNPFFLVHVCDFHNHWPLQNGKPGMSKHLSRIATWKKENRQKYKDPFCRGMMWKNLGLPVSPENFDMYKNSVPHSRFCKINIICQYLCSWMLTNPKTSTEWGTYSFSHLQHASKCSHYKIRNLSLHTLAGT